MREAAIVSTARTGLAKSFRGGFNDTEAPAMGGMSFVPLLHEPALILLKWTIASLVPPRSRARNPTISVVYARLPAVCQTPSRVWRLNVNAPLA